MAFQHIVPPVDPATLPGAYNAYNLDPWHDNFKGEPCLACPHLNFACNLRGHKALVPDAGYNLVFLIEKPDLDSVLRGQDVSPRTHQILEKLCEPVNRSLRTGNKLVYSVIYASGYPGDVSPSAKEVACCRSYVRWKLAQLARINASFFGTGARPNVVVAMGKAAWESLEIKGKSDEILGQEYIVNVSAGTTGHYHVIPSHGLSAIVARDGYVQPVAATIRRAARVLFDVFTPMSIETVTGKMHFPRTPDGLSAAVDMALAYCLPGMKDPMKSPLTVDFEATGLDMWDPRERIISAAVAWDRDPSLGPAAAWLLDHREAPAELIPGMWEQTRRLLESGKPIIFHNGMFDFGALIDRGVRLERVNFWDDTMCREHFLRENARGSYGLKSMMHSYCPDYAGYETQLHQQMKRTVEQEMARADKWVTYESAYERKVDVSLVPDLPQLESSYLDACLRAKMTLKSDAQYPIVKKNLDSLWNRIKTRYKKINLDPPDRAVVTLSDLFQGSGAFECVPVDTLLRYNAMDCVATMAVFAAQSEELRQQDRDYQDAVANDVPHPPDRATYMDCASVARGLYVPMSKAYAYMKHTGLIIDQKKLAAYEAEAATLKEQYRNRMVRLLGRDFNPNSTPAICEILLEVLRVPDTLLPRTPKGAISTGSKTLELLCDRYAGQAPGLFAHLLLTWRAMRDTQSRYLDKISQGIVKDGKLHPSFFLTSTKTGRSSVSNPSMQNWPKLMGRSVWNLRAKEIVQYSVLDEEQQVYRLTIGPEVFTFPVKDVEAAQSSALRLPADSVAGFPLKSLIIPPEGMASFNLDIASAEIRLACAYFGTDDALTQAILQGRNIPSYVCAKAMAERIAARYNLDPSDFEAIYECVQANKDSDPVLGEWRTAGKRTLYGAFYGAGIGKQAEQIFGFLSEDPEELERQMAFAQEVYDGLMREFPSILSFIKETHKHVDRYKRVRSLFGRYRRFPFGKLSRQATGDMHRESVNFLVQSAANDITFLAAAKMEERVRQAGGRVTLTVHDAISGWWPKDKLIELPSVVQECVADHVAAKVPWLPVVWESDLEVGTSYGDMVPASKMLAGKLTLAGVKAKGLLIARKLGYPQPEDHLVAA